jgi:ribosomal protein L37E
MVRRPENLITARAAIGIRKEINPHASIPNTPLIQADPGQFHYRGDHSHIRCRDCGTRTHNEERCPECQTRYDARQTPYHPMSGEEYNKRHAIRVSWGLEEV